MKSKYNTGCACCGNDVYEKITDIIANVPCEIEVICFRCSFQDLWAYGYLKSMSTGEHIDYRIQWRLNND